jgi:sulfur-oxidizing protein SoxY
MQVPQSLPRRSALLAALAVGVVGPRTYAQAPAAENPWPSLAEQIFDNRPIADGHTVLAIDAPRSLSARIRVDSYTNIHAVAEMADGQLFAAERFVKAAGGCSAPAAKQEAGAIPLGTMRFRQFPQGPGVDVREVQFMIRHPNYSGMQMDQLTRLYVPAHFVSSIKLWQGDDLLLDVESGISMSENPEFRFDYRPNGAAEFRAEAQDNEGGSFKDAWSATRA